MEGQKDREIKISRDGDRRRWKHAGYFKAHSAKWYNSTPTEREKEQVCWHVDGLTGWFNPTHTAQ